MKKTDISYIKRYTASMKTKLQELLGIKYPIIMAPMFLVTNDEMMIAASKAGIPPLGRVFPFAVKGSAVFAVL